MIALVGSSLGRDLKLELLDAGHLFATGTTLIGLRKCHHLRNFAGNLVRQRDLLCERLHLAAQGLDAASNSPVAGGSARNDCPGQRCAIVSRESHVRGVPR